jgi:immune inhibitor A
VGGPLPAPVREALRVGVLAGNPASPAFALSSQTKWLIPVILVGFSDSTLKTTAAQLQASLFDTTHSTPTGSVIDYYDWVSRGHIHLRAEIVGTANLPLRDNDYAADAYGTDYFGTPRNDWGLVRDAVQAVDSTVDWNRYDLDGDGYVDMVWVIHAGLGGEGTRNGKNFWSLTSSLAGFWVRGGPVETNDFIPLSTTRHVRVDRFSIMPEMSFFKPGQPSEIGVFCHEFGHALGLPDLYDTSVRIGITNVGPGVWSLMSIGAYGGTGRNPEYPSHLGGWSMLYLGWSDYVRPANDTLVTIPSLSSGGPVYNLWFQGETNPEHFLLEARSREGFDRNLPSEGLIVHQLDDGLMGLRLPGNTVNVGSQPALRLIEGDGHSDLFSGVNSGDSGDPLPGSTNCIVVNDDTSPSLRSIAGAPTNLSIGDVQVLPSATRAWLHVRAPYWHGVQDLTQAGYVATVGASRGRHAVQTSSGIEYEVFGDGRTSPSQILLRTRGFSADTFSTQQVSATTRGCFDPVIALLPGDDLAIAWVDRRDPVPQIYFRARIGGAWTSERALTAGSAVCGAPAIATDARGRVFVTWIETTLASTVLKLLVFTWANPFGTPLVVSQPGDLPAAPTIAAAPDGHALVVWPDRGGSNYVVQFARFVPDSGLQPRLRLTDVNNNFPQPSADVTSDVSGAFHVVWQQVTSGVSEIHYQRRPPGGYVLAVDTVVVSSLDPMQNPTVAVDADGNIHVALERTTPVGQEVRYAHWTHVHGWDAVATQVSNASLGSAERVALLPIAAEVVTVLYSDDNGSVHRLRARSRFPSASAPLGVPPPAARLSALHAGPNPLHAGSALLLSGTALREGDEAELVDIAGRRIASARVALGLARFAPALTSTLAPGLYFARTPGGATRVAVVR